MCVPDNASRQHPFIGDFYLNIKVLFLLKILVILPNQWIKRVTAAYRTYYLKKTFILAIAAIEKDVEKILMQFWKDYNLHEPIKDIAWSWSFVTKECIIASGSRHSRGLFKTSKRSIVTCILGKNCCLKC